MPAKIRIKTAFRKTDLVTNIKLHNAIDDAYVLGIDQSNFSDDIGTVYSSDTSPTDTDALHNDKSDYSLKFYDGSNWQTCIDTNDVRNYSGESSGYMQGVWTHAYKDKLRVTPGSLTIGKKLCINTETIEVELDTEWNSNSSTGGYDSSITTAKEYGTFNVYAVSNNTDASFNILISGSSSYPNYATRGVDARLIGVYRYNDTTLANMPEGIYYNLNARPFGIICNSFYYGADGTAVVGGTSVPCDWGVVFDKAPNVIANFHGIALAPISTSLPTDYKIDSFYGYVDIILRIYGITTEQYNATITGETDAGDFYYGFFMLALGSWREIVI